MSLGVAAVVAGIAGTLAMDALNLLFSRAGLVTRIDVATVGRMSGGWARGRCRGHPTEMEGVARERLLGWVTHYVIGIGLAALYVFAWHLLVGGPASAMWAPAYGIATTAASWFFVYPCMGFGAFGRRSPDGLRAPFSSLANHLFYGLGMALGLAPF